MKNRTSLLMAVAIAAILASGCSEQPVRHKTIHEAAENGDVASVERCLQRGADVHAREKNGASPLHVAALMGHVETAELLQLCSTISQQQLRAVPLEQCRYCIDAGISSSILLDIQLSLIISLL